MLIVGAVPLAITVSVPALYLPWYGDQALFAYGAKLLAGGGRLYVDFWDNKQPGVYWFFLAGGELFGSYGLGPRLLELAWLALASIVSAVALRAAGCGRVAVASTPLTTLAVYYATADSTILTQVESLVALPLAACVLLAQKRRARPLLSMAVLGGCAGVVGVFKLVLLPIPLAILCASLVLDRARLGEVALAAGCAIAGAGLVGGLALLPFLVQGAFAEAWWTAMDYPVRALEQIAPAPLDRLLGSTKLFARAVGPALLVAVWALVSSLRRGEAARRLAILLSAWAVCALFTLVIQRISWWRYHFTLLLWPVGMLAAMGIGELRTLFSATTSPRRRAAMLVVAGLLLAPLAYRSVRAAVRVARAGRDRALRVEATSVERGSAQEAAIRALPLLAEPGPASVYVFGDPIILLAAGVPAAVATHGWAWEMFLDVQWSRLRADLAAADPAAIYLDSFYRQLVREKASALLDDLAARYQVAWQGNAGDVWLLRRGVPADPPCSSPVPFSIPAPTN